MGIIIIKTGNEQAGRGRRREADLTEPGDPWHCNTGSALSGCTVRSLWYVTALAHNLSNPPTKKQRNQLGQEELPSLQSYPQTDYATL